MQNILVEGREETKYVKGKFWASSNEDCFPFCYEIMSKGLCLSEPVFLPSALCLTHLVGLLEDWNEKAQLSVPSKVRKAQEDWGVVISVRGTLSQNGHTPVSIKWSIRNRSLKRCGGVEQRGRKLGFSSLLRVTQIIHPRAPGFPFL